MTLRILAALVLLSQLAAAQFPNATLRQVQEVPLDSLRVADTLTVNQNIRWTLQVSPLYQDTVVVTAVCVVPAKIITFTQRGWTMLLADTGANAYPWGAILVRVGAATDTTQATLDGFLNVERGDVIRMTGRVDEFPSGSLNSVTQFVPIPGRPIQILGSAPVPNALNRTVPDFYTGIFPTGRIRYSTGEPLEGVPVELAVPLTVDARVNDTRGTFSMVDGSGNQITDYDASKYFTLKGTSQDHPAPDSIWTLTYPNAGTRISRMRGFIGTVSGSENPRGYRISPLFYGDVVFGAVLPSITTHRRNPVVVPPDSAPRVTVRVTRLPGGFPVNAVQLNYSVNNGAFTPVAMTYQPADSTYLGTIPTRPAGSAVRYFIRAADSAGNASILASSAFGAFGSDTSKGFFFYDVLNRPLTIQDVQSTPFLNGRSAYQGAVTPLRGVITADTAHIGISPLNTGGTNAWYMQSGNAPWSGLWVVGADSIMARLRNGDSVSVTGTVVEQFEVTQLAGVQNNVVVHASGRPEPAPAVQTTGTFGTTVGNGTPAAERYEGMLVRFNNVRVSDLNPVFADQTEFEVTDGSGPIIVRRDGTHRYSNVPADTITGKTILRLNDQISFLTGVIYYSFNRYKVVPRRNADWGTITNGIAPERIGDLPGEFALDQNYPNPFNPSTLIRYSVPSAKLVTLKVYDILGREVATLVNEVQDPGQYQVRWDARSVSTGVYFARMQAGEFSTVKRMLLVK
jgi:hypothetical protein